MSDHLFDLKPTHNPHRWFLPLTPQVCVGPLDTPFLFGGVGLGAAIQAMERTFQRPVVWATAQYLSYARAGGVLDLDVWAPAQGRSVSQVRVTAHVGDKEVFTVNAALGKGPMPVSHHWSHAPSVPPPEESWPKPIWQGLAENLHKHIDVRIAHGRRREELDGTLGVEGRTVMWIRPKGDYPIDRSMLAIMADFVPHGLANALGQIRGGTSLDNTIRFRRVVPTDWVLCEVQADGIHDGIGYGAMRLFSQDGELMATASQSVVMWTPRE